MTKIKKTLKSYVELEGSEYSLNKQKQTQRKKPINH